MADHQWRDPLLITDVSRQEHSSGFNYCADSMADPNPPPDMNEDYAGSLEDPNSPPDMNEDCVGPMEDPISPSDMNEGSSWKYQSLENINGRKSTDPDEKEAVDGRSMLGFSLTSPDLVICTSSPDVPRGGFEDSPDFLGNKSHHNLVSSFELSLENGINGSEVKETTKKTPTVSFSTVCQTFHKELSPEASFELFPRPDDVENDINALPDSTTISVGSGDETVIMGKDSNDCEEGEYQKLRRECECQRKELMGLRTAFEELKRENQLKTKECNEAWSSLEELRGELMRKSMHVGSLAFAIEGQVKEKGKWFSCLKDLTRKLMIMKMEHGKLSEETLACKNFLANMNEMRSTIQSTMSHQMGLHEDLKIKFLEGVKERKQLYNKVLELKGNIRVFCRCRPLNTEELAAGDSMAIDFDTAKDGELVVKSNGAAKKTFKFDAVFSPQANQADVFEDTAPFAASVLDGYNVCIFAYGQTGTGKTFTMEGTDEARGVNFRTLKELFNIIKEREKQYRYEISVSVLEVYNEQIRDLLVSNSQGAAAKRLEIRQVSEGTHHVPGLVEANVKNMSEVWEVLQTGSNARAVGSTNANEHSSRSHCIHCVMVKGENLLNGECTKSKLWLVDLAGSERVAKTEVQGERLKETQNINRSLSALGDVISSLATKSPHIPFRNSKLTHLLQDSLGGDSKTLMFVQISPSESDLSETLCSLNFASRVKGIELGPARKQLDTSELFKYKQTVEKTKQEVKSKDVQIRKLEETIQSMDLKMRDKDLKYKNLQDKLKELEAQLMVERKLARQHVDTKIAEQHQKQSEEQSCALRPPLANRVLSSKNWIESVTQTHTHTRPLTDSTEKENNPEMAERLIMPNKTGRASICTTARRMTQIPPPMSRRNSLAPIPSSVHIPTPFLPLPSFQDHELEDTDRSETNCVPELVASPKAAKSGGKKLSSILRRSLHKKALMKSPLQQVRRGGVNVGMEKVRVSIGSRGRLGHRVLLGNGKRIGTREVKQMQKEKEKGWSIGAASRTVF